MSTFYWIISVYFVSVIAMYILSRYAYVVAGFTSKDRIQPTLWVVPIVNTITAIVLFIKVWIYFPITSDGYWVKKWSKSRSKHLAKIKISLDDSQTRVPTQTITQ